MEKVNEATCDTCGRLFMTTVKRFHCSHCDRYFHVCPSCRSEIPKCRYCGVVLKRKSETQPNRMLRHRIFQETR